jgi:hypothetical protein
MWSFSQKPGLLTEKYAQKEQRKDPQRFEGKPGKLTADRVRRRR